MQLFIAIYQALIAAHIAEALHSDYLLEWMKNISNDLTKLENDAAPSGFSILWNRYVHNQRFSVVFGRPFVFASIVAIYSS